MKLYPNKMYYFLLPLLLIALMIGYVVQSDDDIYIGVIGPMTGNDKMLGQALREGVTFYVAKLNKQDGINGRRVRLIYKNDRNDRKLAKKYAEEIATDKRISAVIGHVFSGPALAARDTYIRHQVPAIITTATNPAITKDNQWVFRMVLDDTYQAHYAAHYAHQVFHTKQLLLNIPIQHTEKVWAMNLTVRYLVSGFKLSKRYKLNKTNRVIYQIKQQGS